MKTIDDYQALGRIEGAAMAQVAMAQCRGFTQDKLAQVQEVRIAALVQRAAGFRDSGATVEQCEAFITAADGRFYDALAEIRLSLELSPPEPPATPPAANGNRKARRAAKAGRPARRTLRAASKAEDLPPTALPLRREDWHFRSCGPLHIAVAMHTNMGGLYWTKIAASDLPNDLVSLDDLERVVINRADATAIEEGVFPRPSYLSSGAAFWPEG